MTFLFCICLGLGAICSSLCIGQFGHSYYKQHKANKKAKKDRKNNFQDNQYKHINK